VQPFQLESIIAGGDCAVLRINGEIDAYAAPQIRDRVLNLARNGTVHLIADLRGAGFLDSAGLGALVGSRTGLRARGDRSRWRPVPTGSCRFCGSPGLVTPSRCTPASWTPLPPTSTGSRPSQAKATAPRNGAANTDCCEAVTPAREAYRLTRRTVPGHGQPGSSPVLAIGAATAVTSAGILPPMPLAAGWPARPQGPENTPELPTVGRNPAEGSSCLAHRMAARVRRVVLAASGAAWRPGGSAGRLRLR
jgi:anti-anti-sigma factor